MFPVKQSVTAPTWRSAGAECSTAPEALKGQVTGSRGQLTVLKFGAEIINCIWRLTISTIWRAGVKIDVSCYMIKLDFWPWPPVEKWFLCARTAHSPEIKRRLEKLDRRWVKVRPAKTGQPLFDWFFFHYFFRFVFVVTSPLFCTVSSAFAANTDYRDSNKWWLADQVRWTEDGHRRRWSAGDWGWSSLHWLVGWSATRRAGLALTPRTGSACASADREQSASKSRVEQRAASATDQTATRETCSNNFT